MEGFKVKCSHGMRQHRTEMSHLTPTKNGRENKIANDAVTHYRYATNWICAILICRLESTESNPLFSTMSVCLSRWVVAARCPNACWSKESNSEFVSCLSFVRELYYFVRRWFCTASSMWKKSARMNRVTVTGNVLRGRGRKKSDIETKIWKRRDDA